MSKIRERADAIANQIAHGDISVDAAKTKFRREWIESRLANMHAVHVICEDNQPRLINLETVGMVERHIHHDWPDHKHEKPVVLLKLITGEELIVLDDGGWGL